MCVCVCVCMWKQDLAIHNHQGLICHLKKLHLNRKYLRKLIKDKKTPSKDKMETSNYLKDFFVVIN